MLIKGVITAVITPFNPHDQIDEEGFRQNLRFQLNSGVDGVVILGSTGESQTIEQAERRRLIEVAVEEVQGKTLLLVGTGSSSTKQTIQNTLEAYKLGADGALVVAPYYNKPTQEGVFQHFATLSQATPLPLCIYNSQGRTGLNIQTSTIKRLAALPTVVGVKDASSNISQIIDLVETMTPSFPHFSIMTGDDPLTLPALAVGAHGVISAISNLVPSIVKKFVSAALRGDMEEARKCHYQLSPLYRSAFVETNPIPIKAAMNLCGMAAGPCRPPLYSLSDQNLSSLKDVIQTTPQEWFSHNGQT